MFKTSRYLRLFVTAGALTAAAVLVAACNKDNSAEQKSPQPIVHAQGTRDVQPRNPKTDNGETQRIVTRDGFGNVTIAIDFQDRSTGTIHQDASGKTISLEVHRANGAVISGSPDASGHAIGEGTVRAPDGALIVSRHKTGDVTETTFYQPDGKTVQMYEKAEDHHVIRKFFSADGTTPLLDEEWQNQVKIALKLYSNGKLIYDEHVLTVNPHIGGMNKYAGTVFNVDGKATHHVFIVEGPFQNESGHPNQVDTLSDDGQTVIASVKDLDSLDRHKVSIGVFGDQDGLVQAKRDFYMTVMRERTKEIPLDSTLSPLLNGK